MKTIAIIQARMGSSRLPNKVLLPLNGKTVLEQVINRVSDSKLINEIIVATTINKSDLPIVELCAHGGVKVFVGSENDVLDRYYQTARLLAPDNIVRITADCPLHDAAVIDQVIQRHIESGADYTSNTIEPTYPDGLDIEVMKFSALEMSWQEAVLASHREHVTQYIIKSDKFVKESVVNSENAEQERWTLDTAEDYEFIKTIYEQLGKKNGKFGYCEIMNYLHLHPELRKINDNSVRNEGLEKSYKNDYVLIRR